MTSGHASAGEPTRERVRAAIGQVGGYWRPLAAVARLQEELGELAELLAYCPADVKPHGADLAERWPAEHSEQLASELADLWIIATALADQFLGAVAEPDSHARTSQPTRGLLAGLVVAAGRIARIVNYYDGPKTPRTFDGWISLSDAVADFHRALAHISHAHDLDLAAAVSAKLDAIPALDSGRFRFGEHDPSTAASLKSFRAIQPVSSEPRAERARLWGSPRWSSGSFASSVDAIVADLTSFTRAAPWERLHAYLVSGPELGSTALLDEWLTRLLADVAARDPAGTQSASGPADASERRFAFNELHLHPTVFSPLYDAGDPRHSPAGTFVLLCVEPGAQSPRPRARRISASRAASSDSASSGS